MAVAVASRISLSTRRVTSRSIISSFLKNRSRSSDLFAQLTDVAVVACHPMAEAHGFSRLPLYNM